MSQNKNFTPRDQSIESRRVPYASKVTCYCNGSKYNKGVDVFINPLHYPNLDKLLDEITRRGNQAGWHNSRIEKIYTVEGSKIDTHGNDFRNLPDTIVCGGKTEKFTAVE